MSHRKQARQRRHEQSGPTRLLQCPPVRVLGNVSGDGVWCLTETQPSGLCRSTTRLHPVPAPRRHRPGAPPPTHVVSGDPVVPRHRELFYVLALDHKAVQVNPKTSFEDYWGELSKVIPNLSGRPGMERLNRVRVNLKHHGSIPGIQQVADARTDVEVFLAANTQAVFGVDYDTVTMATWCRTNGSNQGTSCCGGGGGRSRRWACSQRRLASCSTRTTAPT